MGTKVLLDEGVVWAVVWEREEVDEPGVEELVEERWESAVFLGREVEMSSSVGREDDSRPFG